MDILATLQAENETLSRSERRIAALVFEDTAFAVNASIIELASRAGVSPPTVTRFCRRLGCQSFSEFKVRLAQSTFVGARYLQSETKPSGIAETAETIIERAQSALYALHQTLDVSVVERAADHIGKAGMVYAFGSGGNSSMIAGELENRLFRLGVRVTASADHSMQLMMAAAAQADDVVIGSSLSGRNLELARALSVARDYKATAIAITQPQTPVAEAADLVLPVGLAEGADILRPTSARYAFLAMVDILATLVAVKRESRARESLRRVKHQMVTYRDGDDKEALGD